MTTGETAFIPQQEVNDLRASGLAHIISISGVHMAIVGGFTFATLRLMIAAWPWLALRIDGKKLAAGVSLAAVLAYLLLSGAPPPAERSAVTASIAFGAILADRRAISLHALAVAAFIVLLLQPEAVTQPGFQMSFAATAALVALAGVWPHPVKEINTPWPIRWLQNAGDWALAGCAISFVAGMATAPFAIQDFNRISTWGIFSNLLVEPLSSFLMMPGLALGAVLAPLGLDSWPLKVAGFSIALMNRISQVAAAAPFAQFTVASGPNWTLPAAFLGLLWVCLWRGPLRLVGLPFALAVALYPKPAVPDAWVGSDGAAVAVRSHDHAVLFRPDVKLFGAELWARRRGLEPVETEAARDAVYDCDRQSCAPKPGSPVRLGAAWNLKRPLPPGRLETLCARSEVVVLRNDFPQASCRAPLVLTGVDFRRGGAAELYRRTAGGWRVVWAQDARGRRPWTWGLDLRSVIPADQSDQPTLHSHLVGAEDAGLIGRVGGLQGDRGPLLAQPLQGGFLAHHQGDDDLAGIGGVGLADHHLVPVQDTGVDHRIALHLEHEMLPGAQEGFGHHHPVALVLDGLDRGAGGDAAEHGQLAHVVGRLRRTGPAFDQLGLERRAALGRGAGGRRLRHAHHLQRPRPVRQAAQETALFQGGDQPVDAGLRSQVQRLLHLVEGWGDARLLDPFVDEHQQFVLLAR